MLFLSGVIGEERSHAKLSADWKTLIISEQTGENHWETVELFLRLNPTLAKEIDFALRIYAQELEHGTSQEKENNNA